MSDENDERGSSADRVLPIGGEAGRRKAKAAGCPICGKPVERAYRPFCSKRCADLDLHRWLSGGYRMPTEERPHEEAGEGAPGADPEAGEAGGEEER